jgi:hypothetical protein
MHGFYWLCVYAWELLQREAPVMTGGPCIEFRNHPELVKLSRLSVLDPAFAHVMEKDSDHTYLQRFDALYLAYDRLSDKIISTDNAISDEEYYIFHKVAVVMLGEWLEMLDLASKIIMNCMPAIELSLANRHLTELTRRKNECARMIGDLTTKYEPLT